MHAFLPTGFFRTGLKINYLVDLGSTTVILAIKRRIYGAHSLDMEPQACPKIHEQAGFELEA